MNRLQEIEKRLSAIKAELDNEGCDIDALTKETDDLIEERNAIEQKAQKRQQTLDKLAGGDAGSVKKDLGKGERAMENKEMQKRTAFLKYLQGRELSTEERSALTILPDSAGVAVPETLVDDVIKKMKAFAPVLADMTLLSVNGNVRFAIEGVTNEAELHEENAEITPAGDNLVDVSLSIYEITKLLKISGSVQKMTIKAFEAWLVDNLAESCAMKIERLVFNGTGSNQPKGINTIKWTDANSVTVGAGASTTAQNVLDLLGKLKSGYARGAKMWMRRTTLFSDIMPLMDKAKHEIVTREGNVYYVQGVKVEETDAVAEHEIIFGNMRYYAGNLVEDVNVKQQYKIETNSHMFLGVALFDGKPALEEAFVKLVKGA